MQMHDVAEAALRQTTLPWVGQVGEGRSVLGGQSGDGRAEQVHLAAHARIEVGIQGRRDKDDRDASAAQVGDEAPQRLGTPPLDGEVGKPLLLSLVEILIAQPPLPTVDVESPPWVGSPGLIRPRVERDP